MNIKTAEATTRTRRIAATAARSLTPPARRETGSNCNCNGNGNGNSSDSQTISTSRTRTSQKRQRISPRERGEVGGSTGLSSSLSVSVSTEQQHNMEPFFLPTKSPIFRNKQSLQAPVLKTSFSSPYPDESTMTPSTTTTTTTATITPLPSTTSSSSSQSSDLLSDWLTSLKKKHPAAMKKRIRKLKLFSSSSSSKSKHRTSGCDSSSSRPSNHSSSSSSSSNSNLPQQARPSSPNNSSSSSSNNGKSSSKPASSSLSVPVLPPDACLQNAMDYKLLNQTLKNVSVSDWYEICWSEGTSHPPNDPTDSNTTMPQSRRPFYGPWLESKGNFDVHVGEWMYAPGHHPWKHQQSVVAQNNNSNTDDRINADPPVDNANEANATEPAASSFVGPWDGEHYTQKRIVTFRFERTGGFSSGCTTVKHTQYCRHDPTKQDRCVLAMTVEMKGIPFAEAFSVQIRWVATRVGEHDLNLQVGLHVHFVKSVMVASQIRAGTKEKTTLAQFDLFRAMKEACGVVEDETEDGGDEDDVDDSCLGSSAEDDEDEDFSVADSSFAVYRWLVHRPTRVISAVCQFFFDLVVHLVATFLAAVLAHPAMKESLADIVAHVLRDPDLAAAVGEALANQLQQAENNCDESPNAGCLNVSAMTSTFGPFFNGKPFGSGGKPFGGWQGMRMRSRSSGDSDPVIRQFGADSVTASSGGSLSATPVTPSPFGGPSSRRRTSSAGSV